MPRNPAPKTKNPKPKPTSEPGEERGVPKVAEPEPKPIEKEPPAPPVQVIERRIETVTVEIPLGEPPHRFNEIHIEGWLRRDAAHTFARLRQALRDQGARTADGREVRTNPDILRWIMEQLVEC